ncbi:MAG: NUDIX domain-containing protein [Alphaproteobacteria bacterium]|nr:NUDIX domain-containing protein [Alphaproteobacteria bacterium]
MQNLKEIFSLLRKRVFHFYWLWARGMTLGVRGLVIDQDERIFLITHTYVPGWHLPGGGVERGETLIEALARELVEEGNIEFLEPPQFYGFYFNARASRRDHVALFIVRSFRQDQWPVPDHEIAAHGFFARDALPADVTAGTRARIEEVFQGAQPSPYW